MSFEEDQEAMADLLFREASEHAIDRARPEAIAEMRFQSATPSGESWRCRYPGPGKGAPCRVLVDVTQETVDNLATWNAILIRRGERPIETHEVMVCDAHRRLYDDHMRNDRPRIRREQHAELRDAIQKLKASNDPRNERALVDVLHKRHHPDIEGLLQSLEEKLGGKNKRRSL